MKRIALIPAFMIAVIFNEIRPFDEWIGRKPTLRSFSVMVHFETVLLSILLWITWLSFPVVLILKILTLSHPTKIIP